MRARLRAVGLATLVIGGAGCGAGNGSAAPVPDGGACSELTRALLYNEGIGHQACSSAPVLERELISVGDGFVLDWNHQSNQVRVWSVAAGDHPLGDGPIQSSGDAALDSQSLLVPLGGLKALSFVARDTNYHLVPIAPGQGNPVGAPQGASSAPANTSFPWPDSDQGFWGHGLLALDGGAVLKWWEGTGDYVVLASNPGGQGAPLVSTPFAGNNAAFRRGARLLNLGGGRLLEWLPTAGTYRIWSYQLSGAGGDIFDSTPVATGQWSDLNRADELLLVDLPDGDGQGLLVWHRPTGDVQLRKFDPTSPDPMSGQLLSDQIYPQLLSEPWRAPTQSKIEHVVYILQSGRSFDSYFGQYCQAPAGANPSCTTGPACCEAMPAAIPGAASCTPLNVTLDAYTPDDSITCMLSKIDEGRMDGYATAATPVGCGDSRAFACAGIGDAAGAVGIYQGYAAAGALADRFFQSTLDPNTLPNLAYISHAGYQPPVKPQQLVSLAADAGVRWALYVDDPMNVFANYGYLPPGFYDPRWTFFRAPAEFQRDIDLEQLPDISVVVAANQETEIPGDGPAASGITFVQNIANAVLGSAHYAPTTLVVIAYLSSGGFYDHITPPPAPPPFIDSEPVSAGSGTTSQVLYGPRVPMLALGTFARANFISHVPLELSSLTVFLEWNWLGSTAVGALGGRDQTAANIGSLLAPGATGPAPVPDGSRLAYQPGLIWSNGFEGTDANAWAEKTGLNSVETDGSDSHTGLSNGALNAGEGVSSFQATIPLVDGYACTVQAWIKAPATVQNASMQVLDGSVPIDTPITGSSDYLLYRLPFTAKGNTATLVFELGGVGQSSGMVEVDVDDVQVVCLPPFMQN